MNRIEALFYDKQLFIGYVTGGDGGVNYCVDACLELIQAGVDILEIGFPFSDPIADGSVIQQASDRALREGTTSSTLLDIAQSLRKSSDIPLILFSYFNPLFKKGSAYLSELKRAGFDAILIVDLPPPHPYFLAVKEAGLHPIFMITPSTDDKRLAEITKISEGFLYYAIQKGTTGIKDTLPDDFSFHLSRIRKMTSLPVVAGFGIANRHCASQVLQHADGFVVGSAFVQLMGQKAAPGAIKALAQKIDPRSFLSNYHEKAVLLDAEDPLSEVKERFMLSKDFIYLCSNSLGRPVIKSSSYINCILEEWNQYGAEGWFHEKSNWYTAYDVPLRRSLSTLLGAKVDETAIMNSLTVNLHLLLVSFYQPSVNRYKILIDTPAFPSDLYAIKSHIHRHGLSEKDALIQLLPRPGEHNLRQEDIEEILLKEGNSIALVFINIVNFLNGQVLDIEKIAMLARAQGCLVGCDLAHAAGNVPLRLHDWKIDFAIGCSYKYLCSGPGGPGIAYVHSSHHDKKLPRFSGWWGNDPQTRFDMHLQPEFTPYGGANSWQVSTPCILSMAPLLASLEIFEEMGIEAMRKKSELQTAFLLELLDQVSANVPMPAFEIATPRNPIERGCQISLIVQSQAREIVRTLQEHGILCDLRPPNIIRITPSPLYNSFEEIYIFVKKFSEIILVPTL